MYHLDSSYMVVVVCLSYYHAALSKVHSLLLEVKYITYAYALCTVYNSHTIPPGILLQYSIYMWSLKMISNSIIVAISWLPPLISQLKLTLSFWRATLYRVLCS